MSIKAAIMGASRIAPRAFITPAKARGDIEIVAVGCRNIERGRAYIAQHDLPARAVSYDEIAADPAINIVYNALPPAVHVKTVVPALAAGKAVLCEKPFAMNAGQARMMVEAAAKSGAYILEAFHYQFHGAFKEFQQRIENGDLGDIFAFEGKFNIAVTEKPGELRFDRALGGGGLMDLGCYPLHAARTLFGEPENISARAEIYNGVDRNLWTQMRCGDVAVSLECSMDEVYRDDPSVFIMAHGQRGSLALEHFVSPQNGHSFYHVTPHNITQSTVPLEPTSYRAQLDYFIENWRHPNPDSVIKPADFIVQMAAIDAIYAAAGMG
ncbi:Gfo/Idh/MocA family protein [Robiginitomaculum antarcticum]|uniref:Gfo/Idh/MocA family protein n=1 Tax=Robiginitomaculum antarcticum TaxID=437507 RepID=UPI000363D09E|nr:Gfo/Idh/MocA family oxidoreductase [Robiginitomaculum antarcticum]